MSNPITSPTTYYDLEKLKLASFALRMDCMVTTLSLSIQKANLFGLHLPIWRVLLMLRRLGEAEMRE